MSEKFIALRTELARRELVASLNASASVSFERVFELRLARKVYGKTTRRCQNYADAENFSITHWSRTCSARICGRFCRHS
jgi:hypothetical protein